MAWNWSVTVSTPFWMFYDEKCLIFHLGILCTVVGFLLVFKNIISCLFWHLQLFGWLIKQDFLIFVMTFFSQLLQFFFLSFTYLVTWLFKHLQFVGKAINKYSLFFVRYLIIWIIPGFIYLHHFLVWIELVGIRGFRYFHIFLFWIELIELMQHGLNIFWREWRHFDECCYCWAVYWS